MTRVELSVDAMGIGSVAVDSVDHSKVVRATMIRAEVGEPTTVELHLVAGIEATTDAAVEFIAYVGSEYLGRGPSARAALEDVLEQMARRGEPT